MPHHIARTGLRAFGLACGLALALTGCSRTVPNETATARMTTLDNIRGMQYCEVFLIGGNPITQHLEGAVFNTSELNNAANRLVTCPPAIWSRLDTDRLKSQFNVLGVFKNGPRGWTVDHIEIPLGEVRNFDGLNVRWINSVNLPPGFGRGSVAYRDITVQRRSTIRFLAGRPLFVLDTPNGPAVMQAYAAIVDPNLTYEQLAGLGSRLRPPAGWRFRVVTPTQDLVVTAVNGQATLVQDELENSYDVCTPGACSFQP